MKVKENFGSIYLSEENVGAYVINGQIAHV